MKRFEMGSIFQNQKLNTEMNYFFVKNNLKKEIWENESKQG